MKIFILILVITGMMVFSACTPIHYPVLRTANIEDNMYGISLHAPLGFPKGFDKRDRKLSFIYFSGISFEIVKKLSDRSNLNIVLYSSMLGAGVQCNYKYKINSQGDIDIAFNPFVEINLSIMPGVNFGLIAIANGSANDQFYGGIKNTFGIWGDVGGGRHGVKAIQPFLGITQLGINSRTYYEFFYLKYLSQSEEWIKSGLSYKYSYFE